MFYQVVCFISEDSNGERHGLEIVFKGNVEELIPNVDLILGINLQIDHEYAWNKMFKSFINFFWLNLWHFESVSDTVSVFDPIVILPFVIITELCKIVLCAVQDFKFVIVWNPGSGCLTAQLGSFDPKVSGFRFFTRQLRSRPPPRTCTT